MRNTGGRVLKNTLNNYTFEKYTFGIWEKYRVFFWNEKYSAKN